MRQSTRYRFSAVWLVGGAIAVCAMVGCSRHDSTTATPPESGTGSDFGYGHGVDVLGPGRFGPIVPNPSGAPHFGSPSGMGFNTGSAGQTGGMGTGLMGFHDVGAAGTSGAITDMSAPGNSEAQTHGDFHLHD